LEVGVECGFDKKQLGQAGIFQKITGLDIWNQFGSSK
jgi:hypothetical protein